MLLIVEIVMLGVSLVMVCPSCGETVCVGVIDKFHIFTLLFMMMIMILLHFLLFIMIF